MKLRLTAAAVLIFACHPALAGPAAPAALPAWDQLTPAQRQVMIDALRERWDNAPEQRARMYQHAQQWQTLSPAQRRQARVGLVRFDNLSAQQQQHVRVLFAHMRTMTPAQRQTLRQQWKDMTPAQRDQWVRDNPVP